MDVVRNFLARRSTWTSFSAPKLASNFIVSYSRNSRLSPAASQQNLHLRASLFHYSHNGSLKTFSASTYLQSPFDIPSQTEKAKAKASLHTTHRPAFNASCKLSSNTKNAPDHEAALMDKDMGKQENSPGEMQTPAEGTTSTEIHEEWKTRPPYQIHTRHEGFPVRYEASCHCGRVTYQLKREKPLDSKLCHCTTCQTQHAAPFQWAAIFHKDDINFTNGHHELEWYDPSEKTTRHKLPCKVRCKYCHSPIMDEGRNMILLFPSLIHFKNKEDRLNFEPRCHMFYGQRVMDIPDGKPKWAGLNNDSERILEENPINEKDQYSQG